LYQDPVSRPSAAVLVEYCLLPRYKLWQGKKLNSG
jgi:hypothetical protein